MKQFAGLALIGATLLAGCMDNTNTPVVEAAPAVMTTRTEQVEYILNAELTQPPTSAPTGQVSYTGGIFDSAFVTAYQNSDLTAGVTGKVAATIDFDQQTLSMQLSDFNTATAPVAGDVTISARSDGSNPTATGTYDNQTVDGVTLTNTFSGEGVTTGIPIIQGALGLTSAGSSVFDGMYHATQNVN